jgi:hypothetical protein
MATKPNTCKDIQKSEVFTEILSVFVVPPEQQFLPDNSAENQNQTYSDAFEDSKDG